MSDTRGMKWICERCGLERDKEFNWGHKPKGSDIRTCGGKVVPKYDPSPPRTREQLAEDRRNGIIWTHGEWGGVIQPEQLPSEVDETTSDD